jgi:hypothetical protein
MVVDSSGGAHTGRLIGTGGLPMHVPGGPPVRPPSRASLDFLRAQRHAVTTPGTDLKPATVSLSAWYRTTTVDLIGGEIVSHGDNYVLRLSRVGIEGVKRITDVWASCELPVPTFLDGQWHHVAAVITAAEIVVYFDGMTSVTCPLAGAIVYDRGPDLLVGRHGNGNPQRDYQGNIDEVRVYTRPLAPDEVQMLAAGAR